MNDQTLRKRIAQIAADSSRLRVTKHALQQMRRRKVLLTQVLHTLRHGYVIEHAHLNIKGNWQCTLEARTGGDQIKVAAAVMTEPNGESVVVITVMN